MMIRYLFLFIYIISFSIAATSCKQRPKGPSESIFNGGDVLRISSSVDPSSLDPRQVRDLPTVTVLHLLYEGLMALDSHGQPQNALAEDVKISEDGKTYSFKLKKSLWSDGTPLIASHFAKAWKSSLDPAFPAPNAYQFYLIKGAKAAKVGSLAIDDVGIKAPDDQTLIVELEAPAPYFLDLVSTHFYYPVHPKATSEHPITNGPFMLHHWKRQNELSFEKNPKYWAADEVKLDGLLIYVLDDHTALRMFNNRELDWVGSPMGTIPQDSLHTLKVQHRLLIAPAAGTHWFRLNTEKFPFNNTKIRHAFSLAINRKEIVEHVTLGNQKPAEAVVPPTFGLKTKTYFEDYDTPKAWFAFQEALEELKLSKDDFPSITLCYLANERNHKIAQAVQQQWKKALGVEVQLENCESQVVFDRLASGDYQVAIGSWYADIRDPINFLDVFKYKANSTNNTRWENPRYLSLLNESSIETDSLKRLHLLNEAQGILMEEMPVIPIFYGAFNYAKEDTLLGAHFSDLGYIEFKHAFFGN